MFGCVVTGRLIQSEPRQVSQTHFVFDIPNADNVNHVVIFLLGTIPLPDGFGASIFFCWPSPNSEPVWQLLGYISNQKPSAIFRIAKAKDNSLSNQTNTFSVPNQFINNNIAQIGLSIERLDELMQQTPVSSAMPSNLDSFAQFTNKMLENFCNYATSFAVTQAQMMPGSNHAYVPVEVVQRWFENFQKRMAANPNFWKS
ncbi:Protein Hikeshi [Trichoplax sp. H2]|nr:Protein Hikeshi [Trichoplax sp. H2]|eukprot:RDD41794.1 Protein Hikeshi [Trichoplax sp. H2]